MKIKKYNRLRILQMSGLLIATIIIIFQLNELRIISSEMSLQQTEKFSYSLTNLAAAEASRYLAQEKQKELQILIDELSDDPMVRDATIYNQLGKVIYQSKESLQLPILLKIKKSLSNDIEGIIPYIAELYKEDEKIGYIRISLRQDHILSLIFNYQKQTVEVFILLLIFSFLAGGIVMALFIKRAERWYYRMRMLIPNLIAANRKL